MRHIFVPDDGFVHAIPLVQLHRTRGFTLCGHHVAWSNQLRADVKIVDALVNCLDCIASVGQ